MKTDVIEIENLNGDVSNVLEVVENLGNSEGLTAKENLHLRLLTEELLGLLKGIAGDVRADWWAEYVGKSFVLNLHSVVRMTQDVRFELIDASSNKKNAAAKGFMGRIRSAIGAVVSGMDSPSVGLSVGLMNMGGPGVYATDAHCWTMSQYKELVGEEDSDEAQEAWDELEKSIVANIADDVKVSIKGSEVEISIFKDFNK